MITHSQKDVRIKLNNLDVYCSNVTVTYDSEVNPVLEVGIKGGYEYVPVSPQKGKMEITYFLTGADPLANNMVSGRTPVSLDFGGLTANSGYLNSYSFQAEPHSPVEIKASFGFYEKIDGVFVSDTSPLPEIEPLSVSEMSLGGGTVVKVDNIKSLSYGYQCDLAPIYEVQSSLNYDGAPAVGVSRKQPKKVEATLSIYDYDLSLPITGLKETFKINFKDKNNNLKQTYAINGIIKNKSMGARIGDRLISDYSIGQANLGGDQPTITGIHPLSGSTGSTIYISGTNFENINTTHLGDYPCEISGVYSSTGVNIVVSKDIISGYKAPLSVESQGGRVIGDYSYEVTDGLTYYF